MIDIENVLVLYDGAKRDSQDYNIIYDAISKDIRVGGSNTVGNQDIVLIENCRKICSELIQEYFKQRSISNYYNDFVKFKRTYPKYKQNDLLATLWFFERIDGAYDFELFEAVKVSKKVIRVCKDNWLEYIAPSVSINEYRIKTFLTAERLQKNKKDFDDMEWYEFA